MGPRWRWALAALAVAGLLLAPDPRDTGKAGPTPSSSPVASPPSIDVVSPADGASMGGNGVSLDVRTTGITLRPADADASGTFGHLHAFIDRDPVASGELIPAAPDIVHASSGRVLVGGLQGGKHRIVVVFGDGLHHRIGSASDELTITVSGAPALDATAPATSTEGEPVTIDVRVNGLRLVEADGDRSGKTGHLHYFSGSDPPAPGERIAEDAAGVVHTATTSVPLAGLEAGRHVIWVVAGDGDHRMLDPVLADVVTIDVVA